MSDKKCHIDDLFGNELSDHKATPPAGLWAKIDNRLSAERQRRVLRNLIRTAAAVAILVGFGGGLMYVLQLDSLSDNYLLPENMVVTPAPERETGSVPVESPSNEYTGEELAGIIAQEKDSNSKKPIKSGQDIGRLVFASTETTVTKPDIIQRDSGFRQVAGLQVKKVDRESEAEGLLAFGTPESSGIYKNKVIHNSESSPEKRWQAGIMIAPNYSHRILSEGDAGIPGKAWYNNIESGLLSFTGRITFSFHINEKLSVQSGLDILNMGQSIGGIQVFDDPYSIQVLRSSEKRGIAGTTQSVHNSLGQILTTSTTYYITDNHRRMLNDFTGSQQNAAELDKEHENGKILQELVYLQTPLVVQYKMLTGNTSVVLSGGIGANFLSGNRIILEHQGESINIGRTMDITGFNLSGIMGVGLEQKLNKTLVLSFEPRFSYFITPVNPNMDYRSHPYSLSLYGGISFRF